MVLVVERECSSQSEEKRKKRHQQECACACSKWKLSPTFLCQWLRRRAGSPPLSSCIVLSWLRTLPVQPCRGLHSSNTCTHISRITCTSDKLLRTSASLEEVKQNRNKQMFECASLHLLWLCLFCTYCPAWLAFRQSRTAWCKSLRS